MDNPHSDYFFNTKIGTMKLAIEDQKILGITLLDFNLEPIQESPLEEDVDGEDMETDADDQVADEAIRQLRAYFSGDLKQFDLPLQMDDLSPFARRVIESLMKVPFGETVSYKELATLAGNPKAARAVGGVVARNAWLIVVPCHRVMGSDGSLHGFSAPGGLSSKAWLLEHERNVSA